MLISKFLWLITKYSTTSNKLKEDHRFNYSSYREFLVVRRMNKKFPTKFLKQKWRAGNRLWLRIFKLKLLITHSLTDTEQLWIKNCNKISITYLLNTSLCLYCRCWWTKILKRVETQKQHASKVPKHARFCTLISLQSWTEMLNPAHA